MKGFREFFATKPATMADVFEHVVSGPATQGEGVVYVVKALPPVEEEMLREKFGTAALTDHPLGQQGHTMVLSMNAADAERFQIAREAYQDRSLYAAVASAHPR